MVSCSKSCYVCNLQETLLVFLEMCVASLCIVNCLYLICVGVFASDISWYFAICQHWHSICIRCLSSNAGLVVLLMCYLMEVWYLCESIYFLMVITWARFCVLTFKKEKKKKRKKKRKGKHQHSQLIKYNVSSCQFLKGFLICPFYMLTRFTPMSLVQVHQQQEQQE